MMFSSLIIDVISETRTASCDPVPCVLSGSSVEPYPVSLEIIFCEYFQQHLDVHEYLKNLSFFSMRDLEI